jgi:lysophospholipase L1-like esterase
MILYAKAASSSVSLEPENGTKTGGVSIVTNAAASAGSAVRFAGTTTSSGKLKIMPLGDSITEGGNGANDTANGYRLDLWNDLSEYSIDYVGANSGGDARLPDKDHNGFSGNCIKRTPCNGYDSNTLYVQTAGWLNTYNPDVVIMQGGTNDFYGNITEDQVESWFEDWVNLVFATKPNVRVVAFGGPWKTDYYAQAQNFVLAQKAAGKKIDWVSYDGIALADGTHPTSGGYKTLADRLAPKVKSLLAN